MPKEQNPFCYEESDVLRNKAAIRDAEELKDFETEHSANRLLTLPRNIAVSEAGYRRIHRHMLQDVYAFAGRYREWDTVRGSVRFCRTALIEPNMRKLFADLKSAHDFKGLDAANFASKAAKFMNELNAIHPFVEGNGRVNRAFLQIMAARAGHELDLARIVPKAWNAASVDGFEHGDDSAMIEIITAAVIGPYRTPPSPPLKDDFGVDPPSRKAPAKRLPVRGKGREGR